MRPYQQNVQNARFILEHFDDDEKDFSSAFHRIWTSHRELLPFPFVTTSLAQPKKYVRQIALKLWKESEDSQSLSKDTELRLIVDQVELLEKLCEDHISLQQQVLENCKTLANIQRQLDNKLHRKRGCDSNSESPRESQASEAEFLEACSSADWDYSNLKEMMPHLTRNQLYAYARELGVSCGSRKSAQEIIECLKRDQQKKKPKNRR
eukprot:TRINITY_DN19763_c0_g1_i1.p1 TRINITY_DN19763_c0_g1~~TRINITY_DN19763_c0_g1_i1.p1  ORF type:complete len:208 (-),score=26.70 TRINITY_DN19763_c0_g1_i1:36-659(-)